MIITFLLIIISQFIQAQNNYQVSGVDNDAGDKLVDLIAPMAQSTKRPGCCAELGGFASAFDLKQTVFKDPVILTTTDGVGTKLKLAIALNKHDTIGTDLVAMCVNDLIVHGAEPVVFLDYFATGKLQIHHAVQVIAGIAQACKSCNCALAGGETAQMPGMYQKDDYDLAGFAMGIAERSQLLPRLDAIKPGDIVIGLISSGIHSNGYSLVRHILEKNTIDLLSKPPFESKHVTLGSALLEPTTIYVNCLLPLINENYLKALAHITGSGLEGNIPRVIPDHLAVELDATSWPVPPIFTWLAHVGDISQAEMFKTFNMGIGMTAIVDPQDVEIVQQKLKACGQKNYIIGKVMERSIEPVIIKNISQSFIEQ